MNVQVVDHILSLGQHAIADFTLADADLMINFTWLLLLSTQSLHMLTDIQAGQNQFLL